MIRMMCVCARMSECECMSVYECVGVSVLLIFPLHKNAKRILIELCTVPASSISFIRP